MTTTLSPAAGLDLSGVGVDLARVLSDERPAYTPQRPYRNGVVVYTLSLWLGNGFGSTTTKVAVRGGEVVGVYQSEYTSRAARVVGQVGNIYADYARTARGERYVTKTALSKWIAAVKAL